MVELILVLVHVHIMRCTFNVLSTPNWKPVYICMQQFRPHFWPELPERSRIAPPLCVLIKQTVNLDLIFRGFVMQWNASSAFRLGVPRPSRICFWRFVSIPVYFFGERNDLKLTWKFQVVPLPEEGSCPSQTNEGCGTDPEATSSKLRCSKQRLGKDEDTSPNSLKEVEYK